MKDRFGKLQRLTIKGFKSIREMDNLKMTDINIVIGQNGAGKSNFIGFFRFLAKMARREMQDYVIKQGGLSKVLHFGPSVTPLLQISIRSNETRYDAVLQPTVEGQLVIVSELLVPLADKSEAWSVSVVDNTPKSPESLIRRAGQNAGVNPHLRNAISNWETLTDWRIYHFHDTSENAPLRSSASLTEPEQLAANGGNLAAFLYLLQERHPDRFDAVLETMRLIAPFIGTLVLRPEALNPNLIRLRWRHVGHDELFDVSDLSDGTLRFLALTALLLQPDPPSTIVLDEPELGLHPAAITQLAALMHQVAPQVQIIAATQSPTFANHFGWQDFIIVDRHDDASRFRRLQEDEVKAWMDDYAMGEIWEKNVIGGRP